MEPFTRLTGKVAPLDRINVDTDQIVPKQFLKLIQRTGFGKFLFYDWRFDLQGNPKAEFVLNNPRYQGGKILLARRNFGCGSSREHAVWAIQDYGFRAVIAPSFADIFHNNCLKNGILPIVLPDEQVDRLFKEVEATEGYSLTIDLVDQQIFKPNGERLPFTIDASNKKRLVEGLDDIALTLKKEELIRSYEEKRGSLNRVHAQLHQF
ncbi:MAG: 3-isopropylmalate dehydratase small subunit [Thaumarchaeota archaeon]|nr:3-isopropylmalate dehydratase small subunit [Nitrososphaerota archaeon]